MLRSLVRAGVQASKCLERQMVAPALAQRGIFGSAKGEAPAQGLPPPVQKFGRGVEWRYATALYESANTPDDLASIKAELEEVVESMSKSGGAAEEVAPEPSTEVGTINVPISLKTYLEEPFLSNKKKAALAGAVLQNSGFSANTVALVETVIQKGRLRSLPKIASYFDEIIMDYKGETIAEIVSASPLTKAQEEDVKNAIKSWAFVGADTIILKSEVDPSLLGGMIVRVDGKMVDASLRTRIMEVRQVLLSDL
eukprot:jgi/Mesvir1/22601/Mv17189-RA.1